MKSFLTARFRLFMVPPSCCIEIDEYEGPLPAGTRGFGSCDEEVVELQKKYPEVPVTLGDIEVHLAPGDVVYVDGEPTQRVRIVC